MKTAVVSGATGMIASALIRVLVEKGVRVYALCKPDEPHTDDYFRSDLVAAIEADISDFGSVADKINEKCDVFYHFAWLGTFGNVRDDAYLQSDNIRYTLDAVKLANDLGCECFIGAGSQAEYGPVTEKLTADTYAAPVTGYGIAKYTAGKLSRMYCQRLGMRHVWARILSVYGQKGNPNSIISASVKRMLDGEYCPFTKGEQDWDFLHCDDAGLAFYCMGESGADGAVYPLGSGKTRKLSEYITAMRDVVNPNAELGIGDLPYNDNQVMYLCADISKLTAETGFVPQVSFEEGVRRTAEWIKNNG